MIKLFRVEFLRHRNLAIGIGVVHALVLYYLFTLNVSILVPPLPIIWLLILLALSVGFSVFQLALYRRGADWIYLLHRPLAPRQIFTALASAGLALCALMTLVPALFLLLLLNNSNMAGVEAQHYLVLLYAAAVMATGYFCGCFALLGSNRLSVLALALVFIYVHGVIGMRVLLMAPVLVAWTWWLAGSAFKPNLSQAPTQPWRLLLGEVAVQYGCLWLLILAFAGGNAAYEALTDTDTFRRPAAGSDYQLRQLPAQDMLQYALQHSVHPDAGFLGQQAALGATFDLPAPFDASYSLRYQSSHPANKLRLIDATTETHWIFSHQHMLYQGVDGDSKDIVGWLGPDGFHTEATPPATRFSSVPLAGSGDFVTEANKLYHIDWELQRLDLLYQAATEQFIDTPTVGDNLSTLMSETQLFIFRTSDLLQLDFKPQPRAIATIPSPENPRYRRIVVLELINGYLVAVQTDSEPASFAADFADFGHTQLQVFRIANGATEVEEIANLSLAPNVGDAIYSNFVMAPGIRLLTDLFWGWYLEKSIERTLPVPYVSFPPYIWLLTFFVSVASAALTGWLLRLTTLPVRTKAFWIIGNAFTGLVGLISFLAGHFGRLPRPVPAISQEQRAA